MALMVLSFLIFIVGAFLYFREEREARHCSHQHPRKHQPETSNEPLAAAVGMAMGGTFDPIIASSDQKSVQDAQTTTSILDSVNDVSDLVEETICLEELDELDLL